jgi:curli biogenesis system outer membrane secretion channel CsgG
MRSKSILSIFLLSVSIFISVDLIAQKQDKDSELSPVIPIPEYTPAGNEPRVTVLEFKNESFFDSPVLGKAVTTMFQSALVESKRFVLVDRSLLTTKMNEYNLNFDQITTDELIKICKDLGVNYIITGAVTEFGIKATGTTVKTKVTDSNTRLGVGLSLQMGKGTSMVALDIKFTDVESKEVPFTGTTTGTATAKNAIFGGELLLPIRIGTAVEVDFGNKGFDETLAGRSMRNASRQLINEIIEGKLYNW